MKKDKTLLLEPGGGLGNRILAISSGFNLARDCNIDRIVLLWRNNNECGCDFEDVFSEMPLPCEVKTLHFGKKSYKTLLSKGRIISALRKAIHWRLYSTFRASMRKYQLDTQENRISEEDFRNIKTQVDNWPHEKLYIEAYYQFYGENSCKGISFNEEILARIEAFKRRNGEYFAMHIRRTDNEMAIKNSPTELFYDKVEELVRENPSQKIYLATDDAGILADLKHRYPENIVSEATKAADRRSTEGIQFALYEMLIIANAKTVFASYGSTFTKIANVIGGNEMIVLTKQH